MENTFWASFNDGNILTIEDDEESEGLASRVLNYYGIECTDSNSGSLNGIDIKHMDALNIIKLSLLEQASKDGSMLELYMNEDGKAEFIKIGEFDGNVTDIYHTVQTMSYKEECSGVMVTGGKPIPVRKGIEWKPIWGNGEKQIFDTRFMTPNCKLSHYSQFCTIVFKDPNLNTEFEDGIDNLYEKGIGEELGPYDTIIGWAYYVDTAKLATSATSVRYNTQAKVPIKIEERGETGPYVGNLQKQPEMPEDLETQACWTNAIGGKVNHEDGVIVPIPDYFRYEDRYGTKIDNLITVESVYLVGRMIDYCRGGPIDEKASIEEPTENNTVIITVINSSTEDMYKLTEGEHYVIAYDDSAQYKTPYIVFADKSYKDAARYGTDVEFKILERCLYAEKTGKVEDKGTIIPLDKNRAILVHDIYAIVLLDTPSITIHDPHIEGNDGGRAREIAENLVFNVMPLICTDEPPPVAFNGTVIDQTLGIVDHDPTTVQNFEDTPMEQAVKQMDRGGGMTLNLSFLDESGAAKLSEVLYKYMNSGDGIETTYICGPEADPKLGGIGPSGGIVNNITYSYTDMSSYTISVNEGPRLVGNMAQISTKATEKQSSNFSTKGTIIADIGNHIYYKVNIDGLGVRLAINAQSEILRVGDQVNVTIYNNPVEE